MVLGYWRYLPQASSDSACRYPRWNCHRVCHGVPQWKWAVQPDYWWIFDQWKCPIYWNFSNLGRGFLCIVNIQDHVEAIGWESSSNVNPGSCTPGSSTVTVIWGEIFAHSTLNWSGNLDVSVNSSPDDSPWSPASPRVSRRRIHKDFFYRMCRQRLLRQSNLWVSWRRQDRSFSDGLATQ